MEMLFMQLYNGKRVMIYYSGGQDCSYQIECEGHLIGYMYIKSYDTESELPLWVGSSETLQPYLFEISRYIETTLGLKNKEVISI
jgi:hypothetical protein